MEGLPQGLVLVSSSPDRICEGHLVFVIVEVKCLIVGVREDVAVHQVGQGFPDLGSLLLVDVVSNFRSGLIVH